MMRISRHRIRSFLLGTGTVLTLLFTFLAILLILRTDPHETSKAHLQRAENMVSQAAQENTGPTMRKDLMQAAFREYLQAMKADPYNPQVWQALPEYTENLPPAMLPRMMTVRRQILALESAESEKFYRGAR